MPARKRPAAGNATTAPGSTTCRKRSRADEYDDVACLGEGGFGAVVMARNRATGKTVAIKRLTSPSATSAAELQREAGFLRACSVNPYVVDFEGLAPDPRTNGGLSLVMEHVAGPSLHAFLWDRRHGPPLPESTVRSFMWKLLTGAKLMHARHVIHRDIKPANILVGRDGELVKICDLGLAISVVDPPPYTQAGTPFYMAPEMLLQKPDYDALVDTWSLGCVMAEMLAGGKALFLREDGYVDEISQLWSIIRVLGMPDERTWPGFNSLPLAMALQLLPLPAGHEHNRLRDLFPEDKLSEEGFQVLQGLLMCNPDKRLTAAKALKYPWFAAPAAAVALPRKKATPLSFIPPTAPEKNVLNIPVAMWNAQRV
nr:putative cyclin-dependent kinase F-2 [Lolium perenne]